MNFPRGRRSTPQRPSHDGYVSPITSSAASSPARAPNPLALPVESPPRRAGSPQRAGCVAGWSLVPVDAITMQSQAHAADPLKC